MGFFGKDAISGGTPMAICSLVFHYIISFTFTLLFFLLCSKMLWLYKNKIIAGLLYGIFAWLIMNRIVIPLSQPFNINQAIIAAVILMACIGLPISFIIGKYYDRK